MNRQNTTRYESVLMFWLAVLIPYFDKKNDKKMRYLKNPAVMSSRTVLLQIPASRRRLSTAALREASLKPSLLSRGLSFALLLRTRVGFMAFCVFFASDCSLLLYTMNTENSSLPIIENLCLGSLESSAALSWERSLWIFSKPSCLGSSYTTHTPPGCFDRSRSSRDHLVGLVPKSLCLPAK